MADISLINILFILSFWQSKVLIMDKYLSFLSLGSSSFELILIMGSIIFSKIILTFLLCVIFSSS